MAVSDTYTTASTVGLIFAKELYMSIFSEIMIVSFKNYDVSQCIN